MNPSIRRYLLINLLLGATIIIVLTSIGNFYLARKDIERHLDVILSQSAYLMSALLSNDSHERDIEQLQNLVNEIPQHMAAILKREYDNPNYLYQSNLEFQIWSYRTRKLLLSSKQAPSTPLSNFKSGYTTQYHNNEPWRIFTLPSEKSNHTVIVAERFNSRTALGHRITNDFLFIMLLAYPLFGFLIWGIVGRGLATLQKVADEVSHRAPNYLDPVQVKSIPIEIKPVVDELNQLFLRLHQALEREKRFAGDAAHELRTPLAALRTQTQVALKTIDPQTRAEAFANILAGVDRCTHIVEQLLTLSRTVPEATYMADVSEINLKQLITEVLAQIAPVAIQKHIDIEFIDEAKHYTLIGNPTALAILTRNLVDNAIRYTPEEGQIRVYLLNEDGAILLRVQDNGPGIPPELRTRVFERFFRVLGNKSPGSGLGLAIVQQIVNVHQAKIHLSSPDEGQGLIMDVIFPIPPTH